MPFRNHDVIHHILEIFICCLMFATILSACGSPMSIASEKKGGTIIISLNTGFVLGIKQEATLQDADLLIRFVSVVKDSRCPKGVKCIWEGDAEVLIEVKKGRETELLNLHTSQRFKQEEMFESFRIKLTALTPYPEKDVEINPEKYMSTLLVKKD